MKRFDVLTLFPETIDNYISASILGRAQKNNLIKVQSWNIRDFTTDKHRTVDDTPYGGGAGMVMKIEPIDKTLQEIAKVIPRKQQRIIVLSARGPVFTQAKAQELAADKRSLTLICGRYEGIDQRVIDHLADEELSIGSYVLAGGELPALVVVEAVARLLPGVLGNPDSLLEESHNQDIESEHAQYTKPEDYLGWSVPEVLLSGNHAEIKKWRSSQNKSEKTV